MTEKNTWTVAWIPDHQKPPLDKAGVAEIGGRIIEENINQAYAIEVQRCLTIATAGMEGCYIIMSAMTNGCEEI